MKRKEPEQAVDIAFLELELARTKAQETTLAKGFKLEIAKLNLELKQKKSQQTSTKEQQLEGPKFPESTCKAALQAQEVKRARKLVPLLNTTESSQKGKSKQGTQSGLPTGATKLSPKPRAQGKNQKKPTRKPSARSQKSNQGSSKKKAILDQLQDQPHIFTNRPKEAAEVPNQVPAEFGKQMEAFVDHLKDILTKRDEIYLEKINKLEILQDTNAKSLKILTDKVLDMSKSNLDLFKETVTESLQRTDTVMTTVHEERERADNKHEDLSREVTLTQKQLEKMDQTIKELTEVVNQLRKDAVKKGKKSQVRRVQQSPTLPPPPVPVAQIVNLFRPSVQPGLSSGATSRTAPAINDLGYDNRNLQGLHMVGEEHSDLLFLGPPETCEHMRQKEEGKRQFGKITSYYS